MKKGFTLIEIVIALAILLVSVTTANVMYSTASQIWKISSYNANTAAFNQAIAQRMRAEGKRNIEIIYKNTDKKDFYLYFNNVDGITAGVTTNDGIDDAIDLAINNTTDNKFKVLGVATEDLADCKSKGTVSGVLVARYGALVKVSEKMGTTNNKLYEVDVTVWDLKLSNDFSKSNSIFMIGR